MGTATRRRERVARWALAAGVLVMVAASLLAPPQPELLTPGACQIAPCGMLEDTPRYRVAVIVWILGAALSALATPLAVAPARRPSVLLVAMTVLFAPFALVGLFLVAFLVSLWTSAPGGWTVLVVLPLALIGSVAGQVWRVAGRRSAGFGSRRVLA